MHPHTATAPPSFPTSAAPGPGPYPAPDPAAAPYVHPYPYSHYPPQYAVPAQAAAEAADTEPGPPGAEDEPQAPGTEGEAQAAAPYGYLEGYTDPAYAYQYGSYTDPQTGYTYPYDPQQAYGYDQNYYGYDASYAQYAQTSEAQAAAGQAGVMTENPPEAPLGEPGPPTGSPKKEVKSEGQPSKPLPPVVQVKLPKQYFEKMQAKKREEEERRKQEAARKTAEAEERRKAAAAEAEAAAARRARLADMTNGHAEEEAQEVQLKDLDPEDQLLAASTPAEVRAAKKAIAAKEHAKKKAEEREAAAALPRPVADTRDKEPAQHDKKRRVKSRWACIIMTCLELLTRSFYLLPWLPMTAAYTRILLSERLICCKSFGLAWREGSRTTSSKSVICMLCYSVAAVKNVL